jgi:hypothetical protein
MKREVFGMDLKAPGDTMAFARLLCADGEIFIIMSSFTLLRKPFSVQTKYSRVKVNGGKGKNTTRS